MAAVRSGVVQPQVTTGAKDSGGERPLPEPGAAFALGERHSMARSPQPAPAAPSRRSLLTAAGA
ncbi:hypothetical protein, partial [Streptomyces sparsus]